MIDVRPSSDSDNEWIASLLTKRWNSTQLVSRGRLYQAEDLPGFIANEGSEQVGLITYQVVGRECEITTLDSLCEGRGIGSTLFSFVKEIAVEAACHRLWLITTNDNVEAIRFWQKRGFELVAVHRNAIDESRRLKPQMPKIGRHNIPIRDEIELEMRL